MIHSCEKNPSPESIKHLDYHPETNETRAKRMHLNFVSSTYNKQNMASCLSMLKTLTLVILLLALAIPFYYRSTNWKYLQIRLIHSIFTFEHRLVPDRERPELSAEYRAFESFFHRFPATNYDPTADYLEVAKQMRENFKFGTIIPRPKDCRFRNQIYEYQGQTAEVFWVDHRDRVKDWTSDRILIYFHGGGYILGDFSSQYSRSIEDGSTNRSKSVFRLQWI